MKKFILALVALFLTLAALPGVAYAQMSCKRAQNLYDQSIITKDAWQAACGKAKEKDDDVGQKNQEKDDDKPSTPPKTSTSGNNNPPGFICNQRKGEQGVTLQQGNNSYVPWGVWKKDKKAWQAYCSGQSDVNPLDTEAGGEGDNDGDAEDTDETDTPSGLILALLALLISAYAIWRKSKDRPDLEKRLDKLEKNDEVQEAMKQLLELKNQLEEVKKNPLI
jgi:hypothetical protein